MAFDAGSVVGHFTLETGGYEAGANRVNKSTTGMTGSVLKANIAYDLLKKGIKIVTDFLRDSVGEYSKHQLAVEQTEAVLKSTGYAAGITAKEVIGLSDSFMQMSGIEHDNILQAENLLLTFTKIGKDIFPQATQAMLDMSVALKQDVSSSAIQLGKALQDPVLGVTALRRVGVAFNEDQVALIKTLVATGQQAKAQALILKELQTEFGGSAKAARETFAGALKNLDNQIGEVKETFGSYIASVGKPFVEMTANMVKGVNEFLNSTEGMKKIASVISPVAGILATAFEAGKMFFGMIKEFVGTVAGDLAKGFTEIVGKGNEQNTIFLILGSTVKTISIAFAILGKVIGAVIQYDVNLINVIKDSIGILVDFGIAIADPFNKSKWDKVGQDIDKAWNGIKKTAIDVYTGVVDIIKTTKEEFKDFASDAQKIGNQLETTYTKTESTFDNIFAKMRQGTKDTQQALIPLKDYSREIQEAMERTNQLKSQATPFADTWKNTFDELKGSLKESIAQFGFWSDETSNAINKLVSHVTQLAGNIVSTIGQAFTQIFAMQDMSLQNQQTLLDNDYKKRKAYIEANVTDETQKADQLAALDKEYAQKSADIKKKQWENQRNAAIVSAIISTAQAVMQTFATFGWPWGIIPAAIMAVIGAAQVGMIASQPTPDFSAASGGIGMPGQLGLVGEKGPELIQIGSTSRITSNSDTGKLLSGGVTVDNKFYGNINSDVDIDQASLRQARRLKSALRTS